MFHRWAALLLVLALCAMSPKTAAGQTQVQKPRGQGAGAFGKPYPNPFNPEVFIPFTVGPDGCVDGSQQYVVSVRISNILGQDVAVPVLQAASTTTATVVPTGLAGVPLTNVRLGCGAYNAYWSGNMKGTTKEAASGTYSLQLFVNGTLEASKRIYNRK